MDNDFFLIKWYFAVGGARGDAKSEMRMQMFLFACRNHSVHNPVMPHETIEYYKRHGGWRRNEENKMSLLRKKI